MITQVHTFKYYGKHIEVREITVSMYMLWLLDTQQALERIFLEFNKKIPEMNQKQMEKFLDIMFFGEEGPKKSKIQKRVLDTKKEFKDMEKNVAQVAKLIGQPLSELLNLPYSSYTRLCGEYLPEIMDPSKKKDTSGSMRQIKEISGVSYNKK